MSDKELEQYYDILFKLDGIKTGHYLCPACHTRHRVFLDDPDLRCPICGYKYGIRREAAIGAGG